MKYGRIEQGIFISRPNRFIAYVDINGKTEIVHVKIREDVRNCFFPV